MKIYARIEVFDGETGRDIVDAEASADCVSDALNDAYELAWGKLNEDLDDDEDEDEFSLGLIERPEPTMEELNAQRLWDIWMASTSADPRAALGFSIPQRFIAGIADPNLPPDTAYVFSTAPSITPLAANEWTRGIEFQWGESTPMTAEGKAYFASLVTKTFPLGENGSVTLTLPRDLEPSTFDVPYDLSAFDFGDTDHDFTD